MDQPVPFALRTRTRLDFPATEARLRELLAAAGFGVQTEIDVAATLQAKLGLETPPCRILGACNPAFAHRALELEPLVATLMPCNVVLWERGEHREVALLDPGFMGAVLPELAELGHSASQTLRAVLEQLEAEAPA
ncbi:MAG: DUF302 domain-containing protein [Candidatus Delongbacteria bacterium]